MVRVFEKICSFYNNVLPLKFNVLRLLYNSVKKGHDNVELNTEKKANENNNNNNKTMERKM